MLSRRALIPSTLTITLCLSGCTSLVSLLEPNSPKIFGGTRMSLDARARAAAGETPAYGWTWYPLMLIDLPLSVITDAVLLPVTVLLEPEEEAAVAASTVGESSESESSEGESSGSSTPVGVEPSEIDTQTDAAGEGEMVPRRGLEPPCP